MRYKCNVLSEDNVCAYNFKSSKSLSPYGFAHLETFYSAPSRNTHNVNETYSEALPVPQCLIGMLNESRKSGFRFKNRNPVFGFKTEIGFSVLKTGF